MTDWLSRMTPLTEADAPAMYRLEQRMLSVLPSPRWYYPSDEAELAAQARLGHAVGIREAGELIALNILVPAEEAHHGGYAAVLGRHEPRSLNFEDVMVDPAWRRQGIHSAFLARAEAEARRLDCTAVYATVDPDNRPSLGAFFKAGYREAARRPAYDGRPRIYLRLSTGRDGEPAAPIAPNGKSQYGSGLAEGSWRGMKKYLEQDMLCPALRGRVTYQLEVYPRFGSSGSTFTVSLDSRPVKKFGFMYAITRLEEQGRLARGQSLWRIPMDERDEYSDDEFSGALKAYRNQPVQQSLSSGNPIVRMCAIVDRRVGRRTLASLAGSVSVQPGWLQALYAARLGAEGIEAP